MKPIKGLFPVAVWLLRISIVLFAFVSFFGELKSFSFQGIHYFIALLFSLFAILLFIGGFMKKPALTVFSGLILFVVSAYKLFDLYEREFSAGFAAFVIIAGVSLFFVANGNKT